MSDKDGMQAMADMAIGLMILTELVKSKLAPEAKKLEGIKSPEDVTDELRASVMHPTALAYLAGANDALQALALQALVVCADIGAAEGIHTFEARLGELNFRMELLRMGVE